MSSVAGASSVPPSPLTVCGNTNILNGPATAPTGAVTIPAGVNTGSYNTPSTTYWFAPGTHTLGTGEYDQIDPSSGDTYIGTPGAILSGQWKNNGTFEGNASDVTIEYLTIEEFDPPNNEGAVNALSCSGLDDLDDTLENNSPGTAVYLGTDNTLSNDCLTLNGQAGFGSLLRPSTPRR